MAPTVLQLAPDSQVRHGIIANVVPLQITVRPRALSEADYDAIATLFTTADDLDDVASDQEPYAVYGAPPWIPQAATLAPPDLPDLTWAAARNGSDDPGSDAAGSAVADYAVADPYSANGDSANGDGGGVQGG